MAKKQRKQRRVGAGEESLTPYPSVSTYFKTPTSISSSSPNPSINTITRGMEKKRIREAVEEEEDTTRSNRKGKKRIHGEEEEEEEDADSIMCGICLLEEGKVVRGQIDCCNHYFCYVCIMEWAKKESLCPICKQRFRSIRRPPKAGVFACERIFEVPVRDQVYNPLRNDLRRPSNTHACVYCTECQSSEDECLQLCDLCNSAMHTFGVGLGVTVPEGNWYCHDCTVARNEHTKRQLCSSTEAISTSSSSSMTPFISSTMQGDKQRSRSPSSRGENLCNIGNMSHEASSSASASMAPRSGSCANTLTHVAFSTDGRPIGPNSTAFCSHIGNVTRTNVPPNYSSWAKVPDAFKDQVWDAVCFSYEVPVCHKQWVLKKANDCWRNWKSILRRTVYDKYNTDAERKAHVPSHVRKEDWESFVNINSMAEAHASREKGRIARSKLICPHTSGRKGQARVAEDMRQENPGVEITRTDVFLRTHTKKDGSVTCPKVDAVRSLHEANRSLAQQDLNNDPVAKLIGRDSRGRVRGLGMGVSKTSIRYGAPYMKALADEKLSHEKIENKMVQLMEETGGLRKEMDELKQSLSQGEMLMRSSTHHGSYSQARNDSPPQETRRASEQKGKTMRRLMHLVQKDVCVAYGTVIGSSLEYPGCYRIVVEEILDYSVQLVSGDKTFGDLTLGDMIDWPMYKTLD